MATIAAAGSQPHWLDVLRAHLSPSDQLLHIHERAGYVPKLADALTALILVDGDDADWSFWTATPKASPATRRVPIVLVADDAEIRRAGLSTGADITLTTYDLINQIDQVLRDYARVPDPAQMAELDCQCQEALPPLAQEGVEKFNAGEYYKQHDLFEAQWVQTEAPIRDLYRAILQVGVAYYQIERGNYRGALKMLLRSVQWLATLPDICQGVNIQQLRQDSYHVRAVLEAMNPDDIAQFDRNLLKPLQILK
jgi:predicted metal-dependent hydrolase